MFLIGSISEIFCFLFVYKSSASGNSPITSLDKSFYRMLTVPGFILYLFLPFARNTRLRWKSISIAFAVISSYLALAFISISLSSLRTSSSNKTLLRSSSPGLRRGLSPKRLNIEVGLNSSSLSRFALDECVFILCLLASAEDLSFIILEGARLVLEVIKVLFSFRLLPELPIFRFLGSWRYV